MSELKDLKLTDGDLTFGPDGEPVFLENEEVVLQDISTRLEESGLLIERIADRSEREGFWKKIAIVVEEDERVLPGSVQARSQEGRLSIRLSLTDGHHFKTDIIEKKRTLK